MIEQGLYVKIFDGPVSVTEVVDTDGALQSAEVQAYATVFPGGLCSTARIFVPRDVTRSWLVREGQRIAIFYGLKMVWEGEIAEIATVLQAGEQGNRLECVGKFGALLGQRTWHKVWADKRLSEAAWPQQAQGDKDDQVNVDRMNRIGVGPQAVAWTAGEIVAAFRYTMPRGETIKRITCTLKNRESGQDWITRMRDVIGAATLFSEAGDGVSTAFDHTLATPRQYVEFQFVSNANQTPTNAYGRLSDVTVYSETGGITPTSVMKNIRARLSELNSDEQYIASNTFTLEPFASNGAEVIASIARRAAAYGDASYNAWAVYVLPSVFAASPDGKPVLGFKSYPALTDTDYVIRIDEDNLAAPIELKRSASTVANWIVVRYRDELDNRDVILTPDDDTSLKDTISIASYGERHLVIDAGAATATSAKNYARRVLAARKEAAYRVTSPIGVRGWIRTKTGALAAACEIAAGQRIRIENYLSDLSGVAGAGLTFLITATEYAPDTDTARITTGTPDHLAVYLAQRALLDDRRLA